jgi:hypothetical protein
MRPDVRREQLVYEELGEELVVYDLERHRVHQLNRAAALVWRNCNGRKTVAELTRLLKKDLDPAANEAVVWKALDQLGKARLLRQPVSLPSGTATLTRRQALRTFGRTAAFVVLMPVVTSMTVPTPARAGRDPVLKILSPACGDKLCLARCRSTCPPPGCPPGQVCMSVPGGCNTPDPLAKACIGCAQMRCVVPVSGSHRSGVKP